MFKDGLADHKRLHYDAAINVRDGFCQRVFSLTPLKAISSIQLEREKSKRGTLDS
jgi:hypothetical protein